MSFNRVSWCTIISTVSLIASAQGVCTWPGVLGGTVWRDGVQGSLTFDTETVSGWRLETPDTTITTWQCHAVDWFESHNFLILRSVDKFVLHSQDFYGYLCLYMVPVTDHSYRYYIYNPEQPNLADERTLIDYSDNLQDVGLLCSNTTALLVDRPTTGEYWLMLKQGSEAAAEIPCPYVFLGRYDYTHTDSGAATTCHTSTDTLDTCTQFSHVTFSYDTCPTQIAYSASDTVWCVDTVPVEGSNYITVYNGNDDTVDDVTTFRFTCIAVLQDGSAASVSPNSCKKDQTPDALPTGNPAATLQLTKTESCASCQSLTAPAWGNVSYSTDGAVTTATYTCSEEFSLAGSSTRECQADLTWSLEPPTCTCILPSAPANGSVELSQDGATISYACLPGFVLVGAATRTCQSSTNTWTDTDPTCALCASINLVPGLTAAQSVLGTTTVTYFTCDANYTLSGEPNSTCQIDTSWQPDTPTCVECESIIFPASGTLAVTTDGYTSTATFTCATGYSLVGVATLTCGTAGTWSDTVPTCYCDDPASVDNGSFVANGSDVTYACDAGYNMEGLPSRICSDDGSGWSDTAPTCEYCGTIPDTTGEYHNLSTDGQTTLATFSCLSGYTLSGDRTVSCDPASGWTFTHTCVPCANLTAPSSGNVTIATNGMTSVATYTCSSGYSLAGDTTSVCHTDGSWLTAAPTCYCSPVSAVPEGQVISDDGREAYYACDLGFTLNGSSVRTCSDTGAGWSGHDPMCVACPNLTITTGGNYTLETDGTVTRASFICLVNYTISGKTTLTCQTDATWDNTQPACVLCGVVQDPTGGNVTLYSDGDTVTKAMYSCDVGHTLSGASLLTCDDTGQWDLSPPTCAECPARSAPSSGSINVTSDGQTTQASYSCADGYSLRGQTTVTCRTDGNWNAPSPSCYCDTPAAPANGSVSVMGDAISYSCDVGSTLSGDATGTCQTDGSGWSIATPTCEACKAVSDITNGSLTLDTDGATTVATYTCDLGGTLLGEAVIRCNTSGSWEVAQPQCVLCPELIPVTSGSVAVSTNDTETRATFTCSPGYHPSGSTVLICTTQGNWSNVQPECLCDPPSIPAGSSYNISEDGQTISYTCDVSYTIDGTQNITCATDGSGWSITQPTCVECPALTDPAGGDVTVTTMGAVSAAHYTCGVGYTLDGTANTVCQTDGTWNSSSPTCALCPSLSDITSGSLNLSSDGLTTRGHYSCAAQYELVGPVVVMCSANGSWDQDPPYCYCVVPGPPDNGNVTVSADRSTLTYSCHAGFILDGATTRSCQSVGQGWTTIAPTCVTCSNLEAPSNGSVSLTTDGSVTVATYQCDLGFSMDGDTVVTCQSDGTWAGQIPACVECASVTDPSSGAVTVTTDGVTPAANYSCVAGYYMIGQPYQTCNISGLWSAAEPVCVCDPVSVPTNGNTSYTDTGNTVSYGCELGFSIDGPDTRTCGTDGSGWTQTDPTCVTCPNVTETAASIYTVTSDGTVTSVQYKCDQGTSLSGTATLECQSDGTWSGAEPQCVSCPAVSAPDSGSINISTDGLTTTASYVCSLGYETVGDSTIIECQTDGTWSSTEPTCNCVPPAVLTNGHVNLTDSNTTASYTCNLYFTLAGDSVRRCQLGGAGWNGSDPSCVICSNLTAPANGSITTETTGTQTFSMFTCDLGTSLQGEPVSYCQTDTTWSSTEPTCVSCSTPASPDSGSVTMTTDGVVTKATFTCLTGYYVDGSSNLTCTDQGQWDFAFPACACSSPGAITGGSVVSDGKSANFSCSLGFTIDGATSGLCQSNGGGWSSPVPTCVQCADLVAPNNGSVELGTDGSVTMATFQCGVGTSLNGARQLSCASDGSWDTAAPACVACTSLGTPANGQYSLSTDGTVTMVTLECGTGYETRGIITAECQSDGTWTSQGQGYCEQVAEDSTIISYLTALIVVSVISALVITALSILLAVFIRRYRRKREDIKYKSELADAERTSRKSKAPNTNPLDRDPAPFTIPVGKVAPSTAPTSHTRHVLDMREGSFVVSPAPSGHGKHVTEAGVSPRSTAPLETDRTFSSATPLETNRTLSSMSSIDSSTSSGMMKSLASLSSVNILPHKHPARLRPLTAHKKLVDKAQLSTLPNFNTPNPSPKPARSSTPVSHSIRTLGVDQDNTISDICN